MFSLNDKYIAEQQGHWQRVIRQDITHYLWYETVSTFKCSLFLRNSNNKYCFVALYCVVTDHCSASFQAASEPINFFLFTSYSMK